MDLHIFIIRRMEDIKTVIYLDMIEKLVFLQLEGFQKDVHFARRWWTTSMGYHRSCSLNTLLQGRTQKMISGGVQVRDLDDRNFQARPAWQQSLPGPARIKDKNSSPGPERHEVRIQIPVRVRPGMK